MDYVLPVQVFLDLLLDSIRATVEGKTANVTIKHVKADTLYGRI